ncbi:MAG: hypothetical protein ACREF5_01155 [Candidatus Saccharimonadales bacterium]
MSKLRWLEIIAPAIVLVFGLVYFGVNMHPTIALHPSRPKMTSALSNSPAVTPTMTTQSDGNSASLNVSDSQSTSGSQTNVSTNVSSSGSTSGSTTTTQLDVSSSSSDGSTPQVTVNGQKIHCDVMTIHGSPCYASYSSTTNSANSSSNIDVQINEDSDNSTSN